MNRYEDIRRDIDVPEGQIAFARLNGTDDNGQNFFEIYHRIEGVAIWGTILPLETLDDAVSILETAIESGEAEKVGKRLWATIS